MTEYQEKKSSGVAKTAVALGGSALGLWALGAGNGGGLPFLQGAQGNQGGIVTARELGYVREINEKDSQIARLNAEQYADQHITAALAPIYGILNNQNNEICNLKSALAMETERRACGDTNLQTFVTGNYIQAEKMINGRDINYHGCEPVIRPVHDCCAC